MIFGTSEFGGSKVDISINAKVVCEDEECGHVSCVLINPVSKKVTHLVVRERGLLGNQRMVPVEFVTTSNPENLTLSCTHKQFLKMENFIETKYIGGDHPLDAYLPEHYYLHPFVMPDYESEYDYNDFYLQVERIPLGELAVYPGTEVYATDGRVGTVDEFLIIPEDEKISHLVLREGHLWSHRHVTIPVSVIDRIGVDGVHLKLTKDAVGDLPAIPTRRVRMD
jgi:sporulation protein YlmC with PRC-barrel domain